MNAPTAHHTDPSTQSDQDRAAIKAEFERERGYWRPWNDTLLRERPSFLRQYAHYAGYPARTGPLSTRMVELIYVALDASASHLFESGLRTHMRKALEAGACAADLFDVLHLVAAQGLECVAQAAALLAEESASTLPAPPTTEPMQALEQLDPAYAAMVRDFMDLGDDTARPGLSAAERRLVQVALHACFTASNPEAVRRYLRQGLDAGLSRAELLQAIQLGAHLSVHGTALGAQVFESLR